MRRDLGGATECDETRGGAVKMGSGGMRDETLLDKMGMGKGQA